MILVGRQTITLHSHNMRDLRMLHRLERDRCEIASRRVMALVALIKSRRICKARILESQFPS